MRRTIAAVSVVALLATTFSASADMIISLTATDVAGNPLAQPVAVGTTAIVSISLAVDRADDPLPDVRAIQFDFSATDSGVELGTFIWLVDSAGYSFRDSSFPSPGAASTLFVSSSALLVLTGEPVVVAEVLVTVSDAGTLDIGFSADQPVISVAAISAGFDGQTNFSVANGNVSGGTFAFLTCVINLVMSIPADGSIDARQPKTVNGLTLFGWDSVEISFDCPRAAEIASVGPSAFAISEVAGGDGVAATVASVAVVDTDTVTLTLSERLEPGTWTRITHVESGTSICLGFLPGDVDADGFSNPGLDIGAMIDCLNNPGSCAAFQEDIDRDGITGVLDLTREIDLFNGAGTFVSWTGASIGETCPAP